MRHICTTMLLAMLWSQLLSQSILADTSETVVVTAERQGSNPFESVEAISILKAPDLAANVSRSTAEALIGLPGVWMQKTNHGGGSPFVRGLTGNQTLLLLDGIRLNNSTYRYGPNQYFNTIDALNIRQVEAIRGAGSVLYGSDALGGTVQVLTKEGAFSESGTEIHGSLLGRILTRDMEQGGRAELELRSEKLAVLGGFSYRDFGELYAGGDLGTEAPSSYLEQAGDFKLKAKVGNQSLLTLAYNGVFQSNVGRYDQVAQRGYQTYEFDPQNRQLAYARLQLGSTNPLLESTRFTLAYQNSLEGRTKQRQGSQTMAFEEDEVNTLSFSAEINSKIRDNWTAVSGTEWYWDRVNSSAIEENLDSGIRAVERGLYPNDSKVHNIALFTTHTIRFGPLKLNAGARFNLFDLKINDETFGNTNIQPTALVGNLGAIYSVNAQNALIASINTGFRAPNVNDLSSFGSFDSGIEVPSQNLSPEKNLTYELGYKVNTEQFQMNTALYYMQLFDLITRVSTTFQGSPQLDGEPVFKKANTARANISGVEIDFSFRPTSFWVLYGNATYTRGQNEAKDEPLRRMPPFNGRFGLQYQKEQAFYTGLELWFASQQGRLSGGDIKDHRIPDGGTPAWSTLNWRIGCQLGKLHLAGGWQNLFNTAYRIHGSGVDGAGSHLWTSIKLVF